MLFFVTVTVMACIATVEVAAVTVSVDETTVIAGTGKTLTVVCKGDAGLTVTTGVVEWKKGADVVYKYTEGDTGGTGTGAIETGKHFDGRKVAVDATGHADNTFKMKVTDVQYKDEDAAYSCVYEGTTSTTPASVAVVVYVPLMNANITLETVTENTEFKCKTTKVKPKVDKFEWTFNGKAKTGDAVTTGSPVCDAGDTNYCSSDSTLKLTAEEAEADGDHTVECTVTQGLVGSTKVQDGDGKKDVDFSGGSAPAITLGMLALTLLLTLSQL